MECCAETFFLWLEHWKLSALKNRVSFVKVSESGYEDILKTAVTSVPLIKTSQI